jgi:glycosyltransferase involved in cell wall biosynthesis
VKGYDYALRAVSILRARGYPVTYTIAGQDEGAGEAVELALHDLGLEPFVRTPGELSPIGVRNLLAASDIFVLASVSEGLCKAAQEAMAMGLPVVTTDVGGMTEAVVHGQHGLVVPSRDPEALADAIAALIDDPRKRRALGAAAAERARRIYDARDQIDRLIAVFHDVVARDRSTR